MGVGCLGSVYDDIEVGLGSPGRIRILRIMVKRPGECFTKYVLERLTGLKPVDVRRDLRVLVGLGWVKENPLIREHMRRTWIMRLLRL
jgi:hypothetical protein